MSFSNTLATDPQWTELHWPTAVISSFGNSKNFRGLATEYLKNPYDFIVNAAQTVANMGFEQVLFRCFDGAELNRTEANGFPALLELNFFRSLSKEIANEVERALKHISATMRLGVSGFYLVDGRVFTGTGAELCCYERLMARLQPLGVTLFYHDSIGGGDAGLPRVADGVLDTLAKISAKYGILPIFEGICDQSRESGQALIRFDPPLTQGHHLPWRKNEKFDAKKPCVIGIDGTQSEATVRKYAALGYPIWAVKNHEASRKLAVEVMLAHPAKPVTKANIAAFAASGSPTPIL